MSDSGKDIKSTQVPNDMMGDILTVVKEIRDLMRQKADQEKTQEIREVAIESDYSPEGANATTKEPLISGTASPDTENENEEFPSEADATNQELLNVLLNTVTTNEENANENDWPNDETLARYRDRCARYKRECEKTQVELGCFIANLGTVGGNEQVIIYAEELRNRLLDPVQYLEMVLDVTPDEREIAMEEVCFYFYNFWGTLSFGRSPNHDGALYHDIFIQWDEIAFSGYAKIQDLALEGESAKCLEIILVELFTELETVMSSVVEALTIFEEKYASELLATQNIGDLETRCKGYLSRAFPSVNEIREPCLWPEPDEIQKFRKRVAKHKILSHEMQVELDHLVSHYTVIGGDKAVIEATTSLKEAMFSYVQYLESTDDEQPIDFQTEMRNIFTRLLIAVIRFHDSLYHQKHAFYFRNVKQWVACTWMGTFRILSLLHRGEVSGCIAYIQNTFLSKFERAMVGIAHGERVNLGDTAHNAVPEELKTFGKESLPKFLVDQMERDTTRYVNLTTIATFFSSVTATTLQFTYAPLQEEASDFLRGIVNLFWFLSLVFSVSSGVSSLLGLTWRKSSIYDLRRPPWLIHMWFDKAPMLFLIIAAIAFVIGLNLFAYLSLQPRFVSLATNILTGLHGMCLLVVTLWFIYQLKHDSVWAKCFGKVLRWIGDLRVWNWFGITWTLIGKVWTGIKGMHIWRWIRHPRLEYREKKLHLQRNIFWAFGNDNRVARLNNEIDRDREWPEPYLPSKIIRFIAYPIKKGWLETTKFISNLGHAVRKNICSASRAVNTEGNIELGERGGREDPDMREESSPESRAEKAENEFRKSLQNIFSDAAWVEKIISDIKEWEDRFLEENAARLIRIQLWGYPALIDRFFDDVRPVLKEAREDSKRKREEARQEGQALAQIDVDSHHQISNNENQDMHETISVSRQIQSSHSISPEVAPEYPDVAEMDAYQDSQAHPDDHSPSSNKLLLPTASEEKEVLETATACPTEQLDVLDVRERPDQHNEIAEIQESPPISEDATEGSQIAQSREEAEE